MTTSSPCPKARRRALHFGGRWRSDLCGVWLCGATRPRRAERIVVRTMVSDHLGRPVPWCCTRDGLRLDTAWGHHGQDWVVRPVRGWWTPRSRDLVGSTTAYGQGPNEA